MKKFEFPEIQIVLIEVEDVVTESPGMDDEFEIH